MKETDSHLGCPFKANWTEHREDMALLTKQIGDMYNTLPTVAKITGEAAASLASIASTLVEVKSSLLDSAIGRDQMPTKTATLIFNTLGLVIITLIATLGFLLVGENFSWIKGLHR